MPCAHGRGQQGLSPGSVRAGYADSGAIPSRGPAWQCGALAPAPRLLEADGPLLRGPLFRGPLFRGPRTRKAEAGPASRPGCAPPMPLSRDPPEFVSWGPLAGPDGRGWLPLASGWGFWATLGHTPWEWGGAYLAARKLRRERGGPAPRSDVRQAGRADRRLPESGPQEARLAGSGCQGPAGGGGAGRCQELGAGSSASSSCGPSRPALCQGCWLGSMRARAHLCWRPCGCSCQPEPCPPASSERPPGKTRLPSPASRSLGAKTQG